jgi:nicotinamide-nucleotide amidase
VAEETARQMAEGTRRICSADYGLSTTGIAGPGGGTQEKPVGTVCIGYSGPDNRSFARRYHFTCGQRAKNKRMFAFSALDLLRRELMME